jgi:hypothetical protein
MNVADQHFVHVEQKPGVVRVMQFRGVSVPRKGEVMRLSSPSQSIEGEWVVTDVKWIVTNQAHGTSKYTSSAQAEVWVRPSGVIKPRRLFSSSTSRLPGKIFLLALVVLLAAAAVITATTP